MAHNSAFREHFERSEECNGLEQRTKLVTPPPPPGGGMDTGGGGYNKQPFSALGSTEGSPLCFPITRDW